VIARPPWFVPDIRPLSDQPKAFAAARRISPSWSTVRRGDGSGDPPDILRIAARTDEHDIVVPGVRPQPDGSVNVDGGADRDLNRAE
jgi:Mg2+/Co2+ transporter CorB